MVQWISIPQRAAQSAVTASTVWRHIKSGLLPQPVKLGENTTRLPGHELEQIDQARLAGASAGDIKKLVKRLHAQRGAA